MRRLVAAGLAAFVVAALVRALWPDERVTQELAGAQIVAIALLTGAVVLVVAVFARPAAHSLPRRALGFVLLAAVPLSAWVWHYPAFDHLVPAYAAPAALAVFAGLVVAVLAGWREDPGLRLAVGGVLLATAAATTLDELNSLCWTAAVLTADRSGFLYLGTVISTQADPGPDAWSLVAVAAFVAGPVLVGFALGGSGVAAADETPEAS